MRRNGIQREIQLNADLITCINKNSVANLFHLWNLPNSLLKCSTAISVFEAPSRIVQSPQLFFQEFASIIFDGSEKHRKICLFIIVLLDDACDKINKGWKIHHSVEI